MTHFLSLLMMVKDEAKNIKKSLESVKDIIDCCIIYDTGSTDGTKEIINNWCKENEKKLYFKEGDFVDFSTSRNVLLSYAETIDVEYLILLDSNDELKETKIFLDYLKNKKPKLGSMMQQCWETNGNADKYWNIRCLQNKCGWRYFGRVHEWISRVDLETGKKIETVLPRGPGECLVFQNRNEDMMKSIPRFKRDKVLLLEDHKENPTCSRTCFYLAQTLGSTGDIEDAYHYYKKRITLGGYWEEIFQSYLRLAHIAKQLNHDWEERLKWYLKAYDHSHRVEPLCEIAEYYVDNHNFNSAFMYIKEACRLKYPNHCMLFVNNEKYNYTRWHLMGRIAFYVQEYKEGLNACKKALECKNKDIDKSNIKFYLDKLDL